MPRPCHLRHALGVPKQGFHRHYGVGFAVADVVGTLVIAALFARGDVTKTAQYFAALFVLAVALHWVFCVDTAFLQLLGLANQTPLDS